ncbi:MAG: hypothetical protein AYL28_006070 [Candidatus Bathyarchaeota archaeon B23]|nr:MAG: hypothetical protein AYL28_006070 [Candidatus Bathyarchaeota archaeon B23]
MSVRRVVLRNTLLYLSLALPLLWAMLLWRPTLGEFSPLLPNLPAKMASMELGPIFLSLLASASTFYAGSVVGAIFEGRIKEMIVGSLYASSFALLLSLPLIYVSGSGTLSSLGLHLLLAFLTLILYNAASTLLRLKESEIMRTLSASATIYVEGLIISRIAKAFSQSPTPLLPPNLSELLYVSSTAAALLTLPALLRGSSRGVLSAIGEASSKYHIIVPSTLLLALYFGYYRESLLILLPSLSQLSPYLEWVGITAVAALVYRRARRSIEVSALDRVGDWARHIQEVSTYRGERLSELTSAMEEFVRTGRKERLILLLSLLLHGEGLREGEIERVLSPLLGHRDSPRPLLSVKGRMSTLEMRDAERRGRVLEEVVERITALGRGSIDVVDMVEVSGR